MLIFLLDFSHGEGVIHISTIWSHSGAIEVLRQEKNIWHWRTRHIKNLTSSSWAISNPQGKQTEELSKGSGIDMIGKEMEPEPS